MAGAGYKLFNTGDVLTAAQVNTYLMEQTVMVFADAAARTAALSGVVSEGMISYLKDTNAVEVYNGSAWVASDDPNAIQNTIVDAKGDLIAATANDTPARLAVGNNGDTLVADSSASTGLRWQSIIGAKNFIINGGMDWWQRGTSGFSANAYSADRWYLTSASGTVAGSRSTDVPTNPYLNYSYSLVGTSANNAQIWTRLESIESSQLAGQTVTISFYAKSTAGTSKLSYALLYPGATDNWGSVTTDLLGDFTSGAPSGSWTRYSATVSINALATRGYQVIIYRNGTESSTTLITGVKMELGSVATPFTRAGVTLAGELAAAMRYFQTIQFGGGWIGASSTSAQGTLTLPVPMRTTPSASISGVLTITDDVASDFTQSANGIDFMNGNTSGVRLRLNNFTGLSTAYRSYNLYNSSTTTNRINLSAEL